MAAGTLSRRRFMGGSGAAAAASMLRLTAPAIAAAAQAACSAKDEGAAFGTLTAAEALELDAIAARIFPTTETPGAREAGVIYFMDNVLGRELAYMLPGVRAMLEDFVGKTSERFGGRAFSALGEAEQDAWLAEQAEGRFFGAVRALTIIGFFAMSSYGGNKDDVAWDLIGFEGHGPNQPPFGYYDAEYAKAERDGH